MTTDERLMELRTACTVLPKEVVKNHVVEELHEALSELLTARQTIARLKEDAERLAGAILQLDEYCRRAGYYRDLGLSMTFTQIEEMEIEKHNDLIQEVG